MTVDEYVQAVEDAIENRTMKVWEIYDLRLLVRHARRNNRVTNLDLLVLRWSGRPYPNDRFLPPRQEKLF